MSSRNWCGDQWSQLLGMPILKSLLTLVKGPIHGLHTHLEQQPTLASKSLTGSYDIEMVEAI